MQGLIRESRELVLLKSKLTAGEGRELDRDLHLPTTSLLFKSLLFRLSGRMDNRYVRATNAKPR